MYCLGFGEVRVFGLRFSQGGVVLKRALWVLAPVPLTDHVSDFSVEGAEITPSFISFGPLLLKDFVSLLCFKSYARYLVLRYGRCNIVGGEK